MAQKQPIEDVRAYMTQMRQAPVLRGDDLPRSGDLVHLSANVPIQSGAQGVGVSLDALKNRFGHPLAVHEIHFGLSTVGAVIGVNLTYKKMPLTGNFVPVWLLGYPDIKANEPEDSFADTLTGTGDPDRTYVWKLPTPVLVAPNEAIVPSFTHFGQLSTNEQVRVSYVGRVLTRQKMPAKMQVPFASAWISQPVGPKSTDLIDTSPATDLFNSLPKSVLVHRITGRLVLSTKTDPQLVGGAYGPAVYGEALRVDAVWKCFVRIWDSIGDVIVGGGNHGSLGTYDPSTVLSTRIPWRLAFDWETDSVLVNQILPPGAFYTVEVELPSIGTVYDYLNQAATAVPSPSIQAQIGFIGSREETP